MTAIASIVLRAGRERPVQQRHPWIFSGAIASVQGNPGRGDEIDVRGADGTWLARGTWSSASQIRVRLFTWDEHERLDDTLLQRRLQRAFAARTSVAGAACISAQACRLVYAESDGLPGLIVDRYGAYLVIQLLTQGMAARARQICHLLTSLAGPDGIYERSDAEVREKEDLPISEGVCQGSEPPARLTVQATPLHTEPPIAPRLLVDIRGGQKTGTYLDQAVNRVRVAAYCQGAEVLDGFCYSGGFAIYAALAGAQHITAIDSSAAALEQVREHFALNRLQTPLETIDGNVFRLLRRYRQEERRFDVVILDPPKFAHHQGQVERATRGYKDINMLAMHLLRPGGVLATFSCSGLVSPDLFQKVVFGAAIDARRDVQIIERLTQAPDHPVLVSFPESDYLKGLICRVW
jgi:23S rRNA (cytosine1962-C5)-methyltransferase